jgi:cardiolipin synthase
MYFLAIASARSSIRLTTAYFAPVPMFLEALCVAAGRGVDIQLLVPGRHIDKPVVQAAGRATYHRLLEAGVAVYEYLPTMLHAKTLVIDGCWCSIGSANFDNRSFALNDEATLCVQSTRVADLLNTVFDRDVKKARQIRADQHTRRSPLRRLSEAGATLVRREL